MEYATYCPEDDKLRLYVGWVDRPVYDRLRIEGWTATPKQDCQFAAVWTATREDTALELCGCVLDEDRSPADRAADRAERFSGYRDRRADEAMGKADAYEEGPKLIGCQSAALAERKARALERVGDKAVNAWEKAEYWQERTAGVIAHALHKSAPGVRMGRIKVLEAEQRRLEKEGRAEGRYCKHVVLRLAYENQMLEAQGGRAAHVEMVPGGWLGQHQIMKVNKSNVTGRVVSVAVKVPKVEGWVYQVANQAGTDYALMTIETERLNKEVYTPPTDEELAAFEEMKKAEKKHKAAVLPKGPPLVNPTVEDAEKLQAIWNGQKIAHEDRKVMLMTQEQYTAAGKNYSKPETKEITGGGYRMNRHYSAANFPPVAKIRAYYGAVIVITDKPQKALTPDMWHDPRPALLADVSARIEEVYAIARKGWLELEKMTKEEKDLWTNARLVELAYQSSMSQFGLTDEGHKILAARKAV